MKIEAALALHAAGNLIGAEQGYREILLQDKKNLVAIEKLALICLLTGRTDEGKQLLSSALRLSPNNPETYYNLAAANKTLGLWEEVIPCCRKTLEVGGKIPEVYLLLGEALSAQNKPQEAISTFKKALELRPDYAEAHNQMGVVLLAQNKLTDAVQWLQKSVQLQADNAHAHYNLGLALQRQGKFEEAIASCSMAARLLPIAECYFNLGNALFESHYYVADGIKRVNDAVAAFRAAVQLKPDYTEAHNNLGLALLEQSKWDDAIAAYRRALDLDAKHAPAYRNLGFVLDRQYKFEEAISCHEKAFDLRCETLETRSIAKNLGHLLLELRRIPIIYSDEAQIQTCRDAYTSTLNEASSLVAEMKRPFQAEELYALKEILFTIDNFFLPYQQLNDRELAIKYAELATEILRPEISPYLTAINKTSVHTKIRVGIATEQLFKHNGSFWALGWLANLPQDDYEFFLYSIHGKIDETTRKFASFGTYRWLPFKEHNYLESLEIIKKDDLDVLLITDVGTSARNRLLSLMRLAPIQCVGWAHPVTGGSANSDYFISNELMETEASNSHYSETLVRLRNIGLHLEYPDNSTVVANRSAFGLPLNKVIYGSVQSPFKYLPRFDFIYPAIAKEVPDAFFVFVSHLPEDITAPFAKRLRDCFERAGVSFEDHVKILPRLTPVEFMQLLTVLDVNLDSIGWTGGFTTMQSLAVDCPVVTLPGEFMRGRHSGAMLTMIDMNELIANSLDEFVALSCKIGTDEQLRSSIVNKIKANKHKLFNDNECVQDLDDFLKTKVSELRHSFQCVT